MVHPKSTHGILMQLTEKPAAATRADKAGQVPDTSNVTGIVSYKCTVVFVKNIDDGVASYEKLGLKLSAKISNEAAGVIQAIFPLRGGGLIELIGPKDPTDANDKFVKFVETRGEGFHLLSVDGSAGAVDALTAAGVRTKTTDPEHTDIHREATLPRRTVLQLNPVGMG